MGDHLHLHYSRVSRIASQRARSKIPMTPLDRAWRMPAEILPNSGPLIATYILRIARDGELLDRRLFVSSGDRQFDKLVQNALDYVRRYPVPPLILIGGQKSVEITMSFTLFR